MRWATMLWVTVAILLIATIVAAVFLLPIRQYLVALSERAPRLGRCGRVALAAA